MGWWRIDGWADGWVGGWNRRMGGSMKQYTDRWVGGWMR